MLFGIKRRLADRLFSQWIRRRDNYTCVRCKHTFPPKHKGLHTSHYFSRIRESTRFDWRNCDTLCLACHYLWGSGEKRRDYYHFKQQQLGKNVFKNLEVLARTRPYNEGGYLAYIRKKDAEIIAWARKELENVTD